MKNTSFPVTAWRAHSTYGLRVGKFRDEMFHPSWKEVVFQLENEAPFTAKLTGGFWKKCPEIRHPKIRDWLRHKNLLDWPIGQPPRFTMTHIAENSFRVSLT
jgi:hypothetical protein